MKIRQISIAKRVFMVFGLVVVTGLSAKADDYSLDPEHSFVEFRIQHLGFSWLYGRFNKISGQFSHDVDAPLNNTISVEIDTASIDTNHAERDKHLRDKEFLNVEKYPKAIFQGTKYTGNASTGTLEGILKLNGVSKPIEIKMKKLGEGQDPWGGYRAGFIGTTTIALKDFDITYDLGPASQTMELELGVEGIKK